MREPVTTVRTSVPLLTLAAVPPLVTTLVSWWFGVTLNLFEAGTFISGGSQILAGKAPYTELFAFYGPFAYLEQGLLGSIGPGLVGLQIGNLLVTMLLAVLTYALAARISGRPRLALIVPAALAIGGNLPDRTLFPLIAVLLLARWESHRSRGALFGAGAATAVALLYLQDTGASVIAAILLVLMIGRFVRGPVRDVLSWRAVGVGLLGALTVLVPAGVWLAVRGSLAAWFYYCFIYPNTVYTSRSATGYITGLVASWAGDRPLALAYHVVFYLLPYVAIILAALISAWLAWADAVRGRRGYLFAPVTMTVAATFAIIQLRTLLASVDEAKLAAAAAPVVAIAMGYAIRSLRPHARQQELRGRASVSRRCSVALGLLTTTWFVVWCAQDYAHDLANSQRVTAAPGSGPLTGVRLVGASSPASSLVELQGVVDAISRRTTTEQKIFVAPNSPYLYYLSRRQNVTPYDYVDPIYTSPEVDRLMSEAIRGRSAGVVVLTTQKLYDGRPPEAQAPATMKAIAEQYIAVETVGPFTVMVPR